jgi:redox-regulated HSP33 family molecular chaperone
MNDSTKQQPLRLVDGKFMRGNQEVAPEIGNREQIALLQKVERKLLEAEEKGVECSCYATNIRYTSNIQFKCACGVMIQRSNALCDAYDADALENTHEDWEGEEITCTQCGTGYTIADGRAKPKTEKK